MGHVKDSIHIDTTVEKIDEFTQYPDGWTSFMAGMGQPEKIVGNGGAGTQIDFDLPLAGFSLHETVRVTEDRLDRDGGHGRYEFEGASSGWEVWKLEPEEGGTRFAVEQEYVMRGGVLGRVLDRLLFERTTKRDIHRCLETLKRFLEGP